MDTQKTNTAIDEMEAALLEFVKRASKEGATAAEVEALQAVAELLMKLHGMID